MSLNDLINRLYVKYDRVAILQYFREAGSTRPDLELAERPSLLSLCNCVRNMDASTAAQAFAAVIGVPLYEPDYHNNSCSNAGKPAEIELGSTVFERVGSIRALETEVSVNELAFLFAESQT